jgi:heme-degrading monooxygenase HmoA
MIARIWTARTSSLQAAQRYRYVFETEVLEHLNGVAGFRGAYLLARADRGAMAIRTLTLFESLEAVRHFAGEDYERERVTGHARATLLDSDPAIQHFDVLAAPVGDTRLAH